MATCVASASLVLTAVNALCVPIDVLSNALSVALPLKVFEAQYRALCGCCTALCLSMARDGRVERSVVVTLSSGENRNSAVIHAFDAEQLNVEVDDDDAEAQIKYAE